METSQKKYTVESLTELIKQDPDKAFELAVKMPKKKLKSYLLSALPGDDFTLHATASCFPQREFCIHIK